MELSAKTNIILLSSRLLCAPLSIWVNGYLEKLIS